MEQNNMLTFITLHDVAGDIIELNPAHIVYMVRTDSAKIPATTASSFAELMDDDSEEEAPFPYTLINLAHTEMALGVMETPEEIAALQIQTMQVMMRVVGKSTAVLMKEIAEELEEEFGGY